MEGWDASKGEHVKLLLAEFDTTSDVLAAAQAMCKAGYQEWDVHSPFPIHGMDAAMGLKDSRLGWIVVSCALAGLTTAFVMMYWMNGIDYPLIVGGKPADAVPSMAPILFELTILFSAFGAVIGMLVLNGLPRHHHPIFESDRFRAASDDKFFVSVATSDPRFDAVRTRELLESRHASYIETVEADS
jgi:Protein of unknown function (DUF3341)